MSNKYKQFTEVSYGGKLLLEKYSLDTEGLWEVLGEDPNCDWGGHHHEPQLGFFQGKLEDVIRIAVDLPNFWSWGGGGRIRPVQVKTVEEMNKKGKLAEEKRELEKRIAEIDKELNS